MNTEISRLTNHPIANNHSRMPCYFQIHERKKENSPYLTLFCMYATRPVNVEDIMKIDEKDDIFISSISCVMDLSQKVLTIVYISTAKVHRGHRYSLYLWRDLLRWICSREYDMEWIELDDMSDMSMNPDDVERNMYFRLGFYIPSEHEEDGWMPWKKESRITGPERRIDVPTCIVNLDHFLAT